MPILEYLLRGIKYNQAKQCPVDKRSKMPITPGILAKVHSVLAESAQEPDGIILWVACCLCFFGFLRSGEITAPSTSHYDPSAHLTVKDVQIDSRENPTVVKVFINASKTDPFKKWVSIFLGHTNNCLSWHQPGGSDHSIPGLAWPGSRTSFPF